MTPCIWLGITHPCNPPYYGLWVNLHFFMMCIYKHCFLPMLLVFAMKCCTKMLCPLPHNHYCCLLASPKPICLPHLLICTCLISSPVACPSSSVLCWCLLCFFIFAICYISLWLHFGLFVYIFSLSFLFLCHSPSFFKLACRYVFDILIVSVCNFFFINLVMIFKWSWLLLTNLQ